MSTSKRPNITIKLFKNNEKVASITLPTKTRVLNFIRGKNDLKWDSGTCRVVYNSKEKLWNDFDFVNIGTVSEHLSVDCCLDPAVTAFCNAT